MKNKREIVLAIAVAILLTVMVVKSLYLDPIKITTSEEEQLVTKMEAIIAEEHDGFLYKYNIMTTRILAVKDDEGIFKGHYRKYVLWVFPFGDEYYEANDTE